VLGRGVVHAWWHLSDSARGLARDLGKGSLPCMQS
jgi:hypothetical protein